MTGFKEKVILSIVNQNDNYFFDVNLIFCLFSKKYSVMDGKRLMEQVYAIFGAFMTIFYIGIGLFFAFFSNVYLSHFYTQTWDYKFLFRFIGIAFTLYGVYRAFRAYQKIKEAFFSDDKDEEPM
jgi:hypothetical protein